MGKSSFDKLRHICENCRQWKNKPTNIELIPILYEAAIALTLEEWSYHYKANLRWLNLAHFYKEMVQHTGSLNFQWFEIVSFVAITAIAFCVSCQKVLINTLIKSIKTQNFNQHTPFKTIKLNHQANPDNPNRLIINCLTALITIVFNHENNITEQIK